MTDTVTHIRTRTRPRRQQSAAPSTDPRAAELETMLADERYRGFWPELRAEPGALTAAAQEVA